MSNGGLTTPTTDPAPRRKPSVKPPAKTKSAPAPSAERGRASYRYFLCPASKGAAANGAAGDATLERPASSLAEVVAAIRKCHGGAEPSVKRLSGYDRVEICATSLPGVAPTGRKPRYEFVVDPLGTSDGRGVGSDHAPWPDVDTALSGISQLSEQGALTLAPGEHLRLSVREVFSATPVDRRKRLKEAIAKYIFLAMTVALVVPLAVILTHLVAKAWPVLTPSFVFENPKNNMTAGGIWAPLIGTFYLVFISLAVAAPIGILAGVYLNEYARDNWFTRIVNLAVVNLAGVPSIVHALFGVGAFVVFAGMGESVLAASCTLAVMTLPVIISSTKEALASVPMSFREACWNMGASRWQTIRTIVLPNSISGILTGVILQVSRAAGETAPILFTGAAYFVNVPNKGLGYFFPYTLDKSCMALSYHLHVVLTQVKGASPAQIAAGTGIPLEQLQYGTAVVLIGLVLAVNSVSIGLRMYLRSHKKW
jgi:phosphate transport system permease protein